MQERRKGAQEREAKLLADLEITDLAKFKAERQAQAAKLKEFEEKEEARKRESMSREEQLTKDLEAAHAKIADLEAQLRDHQEAKTEQDQRSQLVGFASEHVDPDFVDEAVDFHFRRHVKDVLAKDPEKAKAIDARYIKRWFADLVKQKPKLAKSAPAPAGTETQTAASVTDQKKPVRRIIRRPVTTGPSPSRTPSSPSPQNGSAAALTGGKTPRPGQPNSMTKAELREFAAKQGVKMPS